MCFAGARSFSKRAHTINEFSVFTGWRELWVKWFVILWHRWHWFNGHYSPSSDERKDSASVFSLFIKLKNYIFVTTWFTYFRNEFFRHINLIHSNFTYIRPTERNSIMNRTHCTFKQNKQTHAFNIRDIHSTRATEQKKTTPKRRTLSLLRDNKINDQATGKVCVIFVSKARFKQKVAKFFSCWF